MTRTPSAWSVSSCALAAAIVVTTQVGVCVAVCTTWDVVGMRSLLSTITRTGLRPGTSRTVSRGLSARMVLTPTITASCEARNACTRRRDSGPVIHLEAPVRVAMRPSSEMASFKVK